MIRSKKACQRWGCYVQQCKAKGFCVQKEKTKGRFMIQFRFIGLLVATMAFAFQAGAQSSSSTSAVNATSESVTSVKPVKKWGAMYYNLFSIGARNAYTNDYNQMIIEDAFVRVSYNFDENQYGQIRQYWTSDLDKEFKAGDLALVYGNKKLTSLWGEKLSLQTRLYLPTGESSRETGKIGFRNDFSLDKPISGKWTADFGFSPRIYGYTKDQAGQNQLITLTGAGMKYAITDNFSARGGLDYITFHTAAGNKVSKNDDGSLKAVNSAANSDELDISITLELAVNDNLTLTGALYHERDVRSTNAFSLFKDSESKYYLELIASL